MDSYPGSSGLFMNLSRDQQETVRQVRIQAVYRGLPFSLATTGAGLIGTAYLGLQVTPAPQVWRWVFLLGGAASLRGLLYVLWRRDPAPHGRKWEQWMFFGTLCAGLAWGLAPHLVFQGVPNAYLLFISVLLSGVCGGTLSTLGAHPPMAMALIGPACFGLGLRLLQLPGGIGTVMGLATVLYFFILLGAARRMGDLVTENVVARLRTEEAQADKDRAYRHLQDTLQNAPLVLAIFDPDDRLILANGLYFELLPAEIRGTAIGRTHTDIMRAAAATRSYDFPSSGEQRAFVEGRIDRHRDPGRADLLTVGGRTFRISDVWTSEGGILTLGIDITADQAREAALEQALAGAEAASQAKTRFLSHMSHELRTPLNAITGFTDLLQLEAAGPLTDRQKSHLTHIGAGAKQLLALISEVIDLSRVESGMMKLQLEPFPLRQLAEEALQMVAPQAAKAGIPVHAGTVPDLVLTSDRQRVLQVLLNLLSNAIKYNRPGGDVRLEAHVMEGEYLRLSVKDSGLGIPQHRQAEVFDAFNRLGRENGPIEGSGIGLHLSRRLAEGLGGHLNFTSREGIGSHFWVDLPLH